MAFRRLIMSAVALIVLSMHSLASDLDAASLAEFLPEPQPGWTLATTTHPHNRSSEPELWVGGFYQGDDTPEHPQFVLYIYIDPDIQARFNKMMSDTSLIERGIEKRIDVGGIEIAESNYGQEYFTTLPGHVTVLQLR